MADDELLAATDALADHLDEENAALAAFELGRAAGMLDGKTALATVFRLAHAAEPATPTLELRDAAARLVALTERNSTLLAKAIEVQARVVRIVADAAARSAAPRDTRYGASGTLPASRARTGALFARA
jgi:hypothetical protein